MGNASASKQYCPLEVEFRRWYEIKPHSCTVMAQSTEYSSAHPTVPKVTLGRANQIRGLEVTRFRTCTTQYNYYLFGTSLSFATSGIFNRFPLKAYRSAMRTYDIPGLKTWYFIYKNNTHTAPPVPIDSRWMQSTVGRAWASCCDVRCLAECQTGTSLSRTLTVPPSSASRRLTLAAAHTCTRRVGSSSVGGCG